jgi:hypothetical protein
MLIASGQPCAGQPLTADSPWELLGLGLVSAGGMLVHCFSFLQPPVLPVLQRARRHSRCCRHTSIPELVHQLALSVYQRT